jgi:hypothetical protein
MLITGFRRSRPVITGHLKSFDAPECLIGSGKAARRSMNTPAVCGISGWRNALIPIAPISSQVRVQESAVSYMLFSATPVH